MSTSSASYIQPLSDALDSIRSAIEVLSTSGRWSSDSGQDLSSVDWSKPIYSQPSQEGVAYTSSEPYDWNSIAEQQSEAVYSEDYYDRFVGNSVQGADHPEISGVMMDILQTDPHDMDMMAPLIHRLADIRGVESTAFMQQYDRYLQLLDDGKNYDGGHHYAPSDDKADYMGSLSHLRYGTVVGDTLGIDPVFAALLNPTGGIVGPDQLGQVTDPEAPLTYHGIFHDAGGFLFNKFGVGPGYDYLTFDTQADSPLSGQLEGVLYWQDRMGQGTLDMFGDVAEWSTHFAGDAIDAGADWTDDWLQGQADAVGGYISKELQDLGDHVAWLPGAEHFFDAAGAGLAQEIAANTDSIGKEIDLAGDAVETWLDSIGIGWDQHLDGYDHMLQGGAEAVSGFADSPVGHAIGDAVSDTVQFFSSF